MSKKSPFVLPCPFIGGVDFVVVVVVVIIVVVVDFGLDTPGQIRQKVGE